MDLARKSLAEGGSRSGAMNLTNWGMSALHIDSWGMTPISLMAPFALLIVMIMARRFLKPAGPKMETRDIGGAALITVIIGAAFLWIFAGLGLLARIFH